MKRLFASLRWMLAVLLAAVFGWTQAAAQPARPAGREFPVGALNRLDELPAGRFRSQLEQLPPPARERARQWLRSFHFTDLDVHSLHADADGGICYACSFTLPEATEPDAGEPEPDIGLAAVPVSPFPAHLIFHSRPGAPNVLYLEFSGTNISGTQWNTLVGRTVIPALPFSTDSDFSTFSDAEQTAIKRIWQRVAEDFAPFNINVTTERPATFNNRTAVALITRKNDANGDPNPYSTAGGVAYVNVFNTISFASRRPAWVYNDNLSNNESYIAEAASHEIGHNLGLSHDGKTDGSEYYGGHGSGDISWGPLMGTGYNRNVSQWSKGEYYLANNSQDDLAIIAGKISYRTDDHGSTPATATALVITGGTNIVSTTPDNDPANTNPANKGVLQSNTDVDVFSFVTGSGAVRLDVRPWRMPSGTRGGNLDILLELYDDAGALLMTNNPASQTTALIQTTLPEGRYYLYVRNTGTGNPYSSSPSGYTAYGSIGQYFINGYITEATGVIIAPLATLQVTDLTEAGQASKQFTVTYTDDVAIDVSTIDSNDIRVTGPNGYDQPAQFVSLNVSGNGTPRTATYSVTPPGGGVWSPAHNGTYTVWMQASEVADVEGAHVPAGELGQFQVAVPMVIYAANMDVNPGWTLQPDWQYGPPNYSGGSGGPSSAFTGQNIIGYNLSGNYPNSLSVRYATTPEINTAGSTTLTLRFKRWLRTRSSDPAAIQVSTNGTTWINVWSSSGNVSDTSWQSVQYTLPASVADSPSLRLRWSLASNQSRNDIGWNIDDVELLGDGMLDTTPPAATLSVADLTMGGSPSHPCSVTYTDDTAVRLSSLDSNDLLVTGPNGYSNLVEFVGADLPLDGSPITATYSIHAPGGVWEAADNGTYTITLLEGAVEDTINNATPQTVLGTFNVAISTASPGVLEVLPANGLVSSGTVGGPFQPDSLVYTLTNSGGSTLNWTASKLQDWISLSSAAGVLAAGDSVTLTASINGGSESLPAGTYSDSVSFINATSGNGNSIRTVSLEVEPPVAMVELTVAANNPAWGGVSPPSGTYNAGTAVELLATPAEYFLFDQWTGDVSGPENPLALVLQTNLSAQAVFAEILTTNHPTPLWWLVEKGYTNDFEGAVTLTGANGMAVWQSYVAGLDPNDPVSQLRLSWQPDPASGGYVLNWNTVPGRVYSVWVADGIAGAFTPLDGAVDLPATINSLTAAPDEAATQRFYLLEVRKP